MRNVIKRKLNGNYSMLGLNKNEKKSLKNKREELKKYVHSSVVDQYITALYSKEEDEVYFVDESSYSSDERAIVEDFKE